MLPKECPVFGETWYEKAAPSRFDPSRHLRKRGALGNRGRESSALPPTIFAQTRGWAVEHRGTYLAVYFDVAQIARTGWSAYKCPVSNTDAEAARHPPKASQQEEGRF